MDRKRGRERERGRGGCCVFSGFAVRAQTMLGPEQA